LGAPTESGIKTPAIKKFPNSFQPQKMSEETPSNSRKEFNPNPIFLNEPNLQNKVILNVVPTLLPKSGSQINGKECIPRRKRRKLNKGIKFPNERSYPNVNGPRKG